MAPPDSFAAAFDAIEIDPARAPSPAAIDAAMTMCASPDEPGFYLLDDCGGRFVVDGEFGFISVKDDATLEAERGNIHGVRLKVTEPSGASYELALRLRVSGRVPQVVSDVEPPMAPEPDAPASVSAPAISWAAFTCLSGACAESLAREDDAPFACMLGPAHLQAPDGAIDLELAAPTPRPASAAALWLL